MYKVQGKLQTGNRSKGGFGPLNRICNFLFKQGGGSVRAKQAANKQT